MELPVKWICVLIKRYLLSYIFLGVCGGLVIGLVIVKFTNFKDERLSVDTNATVSSRLTAATVDGELLKTKVAKKIMRDLDEDQRSRDANYTQLRMKWMRDRILKLEEKMKKETSNVVVEDVKNNNTNYNVHIFYYAWYENLEIDSRWKHWNHEYLPNWKLEDKKIYPTGTHRPPNDIGSNFYPLLGCYSSRDDYVIETHMKQIKYTGVGVIVVSWYPPGMSDDGSPLSPDSMFETLLNVAVKYQLKIAPHIEPYKNRNPINLFTHLKYFSEKYQNHPGLYKMPRGGRNLPVYYVYDSYLTPAVVWRELLSVKGNLSVRGTSQDAIFLGLLAEMQHRYDIKKAHFDGFYTYFASNGFTYGSSWKNWRSLAKYARQNGLLFVPSIGPGYIDTQVRPWNSGNTRHRRHGKYYEVGWRSAIGAGVSFVSLTSFNEWHEGTQIEPAVTKTTSTFSYLDYEPEGPYFYLNLTRWWVNEFSSKFIQNPPSAL